MIFYHTLPVMHSTALPVSIRPKAALVLIYLRSICSKRLALCILGAFEALQREEGERGECFI